MLAYTGCFSRVDTIKDIHLYLSQRLRIKEEDMRLWLFMSEARKHTGPPSVAVFTLTSVKLAKYQRGIPTGLWFYMDPHRRAFV